ncbi:hypothetical protein PR003_g24123 [Phytophthora rubi]|uniref:DDE Tnp4 domain-containing protein n=1 Tax=Phytophthora rubi TaxID=129364 RepID=A0A6A3IM73_9STRA|nr:hypothetical protein PR002_g23064 [Phytophthora rubi]KAE8986394.1 hypothetical protein PR001_g22614 [Phytophthora rubi]KAE9295003.1 hypothetical protein PR003_g24123 [Phytophthora rubi]
METVVLAAASSSVNVGPALLLLLANNEHRERPERPIIPSNRFVLSSKSDVNCVKDFRFERAVIYQLVELFALPEYVITAHRDRLHRTEALCILLYRTSYPRRNYDVLTKFGRSVAAISRICTHLVIWLYERFKESIYFQKTVCSKNIRRYEQAIHDTGAPMHNVFGFIDGTKNPICRLSPRPGHRENLQKQVYWGHKRIHCLNYQVVVVPDGLTIHFWGPIEGKRHDITQLSESKLTEYLEARESDFGGFLLYGDPACGVQRFIVSGFKKAQ